MVIKDRWTISCELTTGRDYYFVTQNKQVIFHVTSPGKASQNRISKDTEREQIAFRREHRGKSCLISPDPSFLQVGPAAEFQNVRLSGYGCAAPGSDAVGCVSDLRRYGLRHRAQREALLPPRRKHPAVQVSIHSSETALPVRSVQKLKGNLTQRRQAGRRERGRRCSMSEAIFN